MLSFFRNKANLVYLHDIVVTAICFNLSIFLRLGSEFNSLPNTLIIYGTALITIIGAIVYRTTGLYKGIWRYASINDLINIIKATSMTIAAFLILMFAITRLENFPRSVLFINWFVLIISLSGSRAIYRLYKDKKFFLKDISNNENSIPVLLIGATDRAELFIREMNRNNNPTHKIVGILDLNKNKIGRFIRGIEILGTVSEISKVINNLEKENKKNRPQKIIISNNDIEGNIIRDLLTFTDKTGISLARLPKITDLESDINNEKLKVKPVDVFDLLSRPQALLDRNAMKKFINNKKILVSGAGGTIGSELVEQIINYDPKEIILLDNSEFLLYKIEKKVEERNKNIKINSVLADIKNKKRIDNIFNESRPEIIFHAAALKHVPIVEKNPLEGVLTNILGTINIAESCKKYNAAEMVLISTDKAVNPFSVMGVTKRISEKYCQSISNTSKTNFKIVRFGNVLGSTGSVVPLFQKQLEKGGPLTVTHPKMKRYFMTVREAVELVIQSATLDNNKKGEIHVLEMGQPIAITEIAEQLIRLAGLRPNKDILIKYTGLRPGEKIQEELHYKNEKFIKTKNKSIFIVKPKIESYIKLSKSINNLIDLAKNGKLEDCYKEMSVLVPEYKKTKVENLHKKRFA
ncbi:MAG: nucleotide sugar dehydratase [Pelagibacteraceae bacterium]|nr:nucleotide sugar dehydratase [Pelagibacteraceae bacterium]PPR33874.1 MAG: UDP-N-acetyl-alpha-D-glucosamine C6 dehydratase [Alphaproteobacteria bacterium MarineAlpha6_Bin5]|tara:strand:+ start:9929 stop:11836 length:1908 start_codon:yes stop_codon:yes gene_type:complete